jgi:hypothetical protein
MSKSIRAHRLHGAVPYPTAAQVRVARLGALRAIPTRRQDTLLAKVLRALGVR